MLRSKNMILIIGNTTREDTDWAPFEIRYAVDECKIPIIAAYTNYTRIQAPQLLESLWPSPLAERITAGSAHIIHIPFKREPLQDAVGQFCRSSSSAFSPRKEVIILSEHGCSFFGLQELYF